MIRARPLRLNASRYELVPALGARGLAGLSFELKRKADDCVVARAQIASRARALRFRLLPRRGHADAAAAGLSDVAPLLLEYFGDRSRARVEVTLNGTTSRMASARTKSDFASRIGHGGPAAPHVALPEDYAARTGLAPQPEPRVLAYAGLDAFDRRQWLTPPAARAWRRMREAARAEDVELQLVSAYRSVIYQTVLVQRKLARGLSLDQILQVNAAPGYSEHHSGRAIDVTTPGCAPAEEVFETTPAFAWLTAHADAFGFRLSYPRDNPHGILYEPWHWCLRRSPYPCERFTGSPLG